MKFLQTTHHTYNKMTPEEEHEKLSEDFLFFFLCLLVAIFGQHFTRGLHYFSDIGSTILVGMFASLLAKYFRFNSVTLNGDRIPSAEGDNRNVQLDLIPSAMIQSIEVNKTLTPDMEADAIGGSVNLITRSNPTGFRASATVAGGGNPIRPGGYNSNITALIGNEVSEKFSYTLSATVQTRDYGSDNIEFEWNDPADWADDGAIGEMDIRRYDVKRTRRSLSLNLDWNLNDNNQLYFKSIYNHRDDWENRY